MSQSACPDPFITSGVPSFVKCVYTVPDAAKCGVQATTLICKKCATQEVRIKRKCSNDGREGLETYNRERNHVGHRRKCVPYTGLLTEYRDQYRRKYPVKDNYRPIIFPRSIKIEDRPRWNPSLVVPAKPYVESIYAAEAQLDALDIAEGPIPDALLIARQRINDQYRINRQQSSGTFNITGSAGQCPKQQYNLELEEDETALSDY